MADTAVLLEIITYIFQRTPPTADCDEPLNADISDNATEYCAIPQCVNEVYHKPEADDA